MSLLLAVLLLAALSAADLERLKKYEPVWAENDPALPDQARREFGGRGVELAEHFLRHTDSPVRNSAYFYVLRAVGDGETALVLIRALPRPPQRVSGVLDRDSGEVEVAIEAVLENNDARTDARVVPALVESVATARARKHGVGMHAATAAVRLLGRCRSWHAIRALEKLAADPEPGIRTAAASALGELGMSHEKLPATPGSPLPVLRDILRSDSSAMARIEAAQSLGRLDAPESVAALRSALDSETDPKVVDVILQALNQRGARIRDPQQCRSLMARTWDAYATQQLLDCWRLEASQEELVQAATTGPPAQRAAALYVLAGEPASSAARTKRPDIVLEPRLMLGIPEPQAVHFAPDLQEKLLTSAVEVLSQEVSYPTRDLTHQALWAISAMEMPVALRYADRIRPTRARYSASEALSRADRKAYATHRRGQQLRVALLLTLGVGVFMFAPRLRRAAALLTASTAAWAVWTLGVSSVRELPPPPLRFLTVSAIGLLSAGVVTAIVAFIPSKRPSNLGATALRAIVAVMGSGLVAVVVCAWTRSRRLFPLGGEGWELLFDPLGSGVLAVLMACALSVTDGIILWRRSRAAVSANLPG